MRLLSRKQDAEALAVAVRPILEYCDQHALFPSTVFHRLFVAAVKLETNDHDIDGAFNRAMDLDSDRIVGQRKRAVGA